MRSKWRGFTLIELLVAISLMALMAVLSWRGLDGISRAQTQLEQRSDEVLALQATLGQWGADLDALAEQPGTPSLDWDGRALRLLRHSSSDAGGGLQVVAWARRSENGEGYWLRWHSPELRTRGELDLAWQTAQAWAQTPSDADRLREVRTVALEAWQIFFYRGNAWTNPLSSAGAAQATAGSAAAAPAAATTTPDGVRLVLTLPGGHALSGTLTRDWVRPVLGGAP
ncbi:prepilin-type N-terminal cleavage/methylation domain-containing protein [Rhodoferax sp.]|uniref:PulJ/GspJ family protein n=1 Tax=Rhodoferax sp. TaxID=50421 RepID=UPI002624C346|nr:prepilin-type N-terminal cleavage/methylation domain-containing protein [Rhodoferax sp.]MDD5480469.1 prepilin-type N-terminal cleavage/methylation domain-containing protein [Rhodoferax sp.]